MPAGMARPEGRVLRVEESEWNAFRELRLEALRSDPLAFGSTLERELKFTEELWRERLANPGSGNWVAVDSRDRWVGMTVAARIEGQFRIFGMWVHPDQRGKGVGGVLLDAAIAWVDGVATRAPIVLEVNRRQAAAVRLYRSRGFEFTGVSRPLGHTPGESVDEMVRTGREPARKLEGEP